MNILNANEITKEKIIGLLNNAAIEFEDKDEAKNIYVTGLDFNTWVGVDEENICIKISTHIQCKDEAPLAELAALAAACNDKFMLVTFTSTQYDDGRGYLNGTYYMYTNYGLIAPQFIFTLKRFSSIFISAVQEMDSEDKFFS